VDETHVIQQSPVLPAPVENVENGKPVVAGVAMISDGTYIFSDLFRFLESGKIPLPCSGNGRIDPQGCDSP
jgi:hypothetical protein